MKKFKCISCHPYTGGCDKNCSFCYVKDKLKTEETKEESFWLKLPKYMKRYTNQVACGAAGEPFMNREFMIKMSKECKRQGLIFNVTTNGNILLSLNKKELKRTLRHIDMVSISFDTEKIKSKEDLQNYLKLVYRIKNNTNTKVGCNLLVEEKIVNEEFGLVRITVLLLNNKVDYVYALCPKNIPNNILKIKEQYYYLTFKHPNFFVDDGTNCILKNNSYDKWEHTCHRGKDIITINKDGGISTCSFAEPFMYINKPIELVKIERVKIPKEHLGTNYCPFIIKG